MRADRLLSIVLLLQTRQRVTARELADRLEVSERTILRDMDALSVSGIPVIADRGKGGGWSLLDGYQARLTGLSAAEIQSLFLARPAHLISDLGMKQAADTALLKLQASMPAQVREQAELARRRILVDPRGWRDASESVSCLPVLLDAVWRGRRVRFQYRRQQGELSERHGDPLGLVAKGSAWYLIAQVEDRTRTYRVSRMTEAMSLDEPAFCPEDFDLAAYWERSAAEFREALPRYDATFLADPRILSWVRYRGWRVQEESQEGDRVRLTLRFDVEEEALQFTLGFGGDIEIVQPVELREKVVAAARAILAANHLLTCGNTNTEPRA